MNEEYVLPYITLKDYNTLLAWERMMREKHPDRLGWLKEDAEHRLIYGCQVCGFKGIDHDHTI